MICFLFFSGMMPGFLKPVENMMHLGERRSQQGIRPSGLNCSFERTAGVEQHLDLTGDNLLVKSIRNSCLRPMSGFQLHRCRTGTCRLKITAIGDRVPGRCHQLMEGFQFLPLPG